MVDASLTGATHTDLDTATHTQKYGLRHGKESAAPPPDHPHIVFVLVDDWGFSDIGHRNPAVLTPNFDELIRTGSILQRHYVFKYCSPSRASFLTGRWPHHAHQWNFPPNASVGTNLNMTMLPAKLKQAGYATHMVGKWHQGFYRAEYLPTSRGFDTSSGFLTGREDHTTQANDCLTDYWKNKKPDARNGTYDAYRYRDDLHTILQSHDPDKPLFLYLPLHNVHGPFEAPQEWLNKYAENSTCAARRMMQAMVSVADNVTGTVVKGLKAKGMWENTLIVVSADNGAIGDSGSNYPLKGQKMTFFEGGIRANAFVSGGVLPESMQGRNNSGFVHISDWYPTFCKMAGVDSDDSGVGRYPVDGMDVWPIINGQNLTSPHDHLVIGFNFSVTYPDQGALIMGDYKLIVGQQRSVVRDPLDAPCSHHQETDNCDPYCLYNIIDDPGESKELMHSQPQILAKMLAKYNEYSSEPQSRRDQGYHSEDDLPINTNACTQLMEKYGGYWGPWE